MEGEIGTLSLEECSVLLNGCADRRDMLTYVVIGLFCGLRSAELESLCYEDIDLEAGTVVVSARYAKTRQRRVVDVAPCALAWLRVALALGADPWQGRICCARWGDRVWAKRKRALGWPEVRGEWPHNALRHTYASMHYAAHQNESLLKAQMGHWRGSDTLHRHYRALKTRSEALAFWALVPPG
jgi:integrase